jgi:hypothetical protein
MAEALYLLGYGLAASAASVVALVLRVNALG